MVDHVGATDNDDYNGTDSVATVAAIFVDVTVTLTTLTFVRGCW